MNAIDMQLRGLIKLGLTRGRLTFVGVVSHIEHSFSHFFFFFFFDLIFIILPVVTKDSLISPRFTPYDFLSRCKFSNLITHRPMVEFYLLTFPRFPLRKKQHKSYFGKNRTHDFRTSRCAGYLLDHSGDEFSSIIYLGCQPEKAILHGGQSRLKSAEQGKL